MSSKSTLSREEHRILIEHLLDDSTFSQLAKDQIAELGRVYLAYLDREGKPLLAKHQPCGCVVCTCDDGDRCHGCGARHCGTHLVGQIPNPVYLPTTARQDALEEAAKWHEDQIAPLQEGHEQANEHFGLSGGDRGYAQAMAQMTAAIHAHKTAATAIRTLKDKS